MGSKRFVSAIEMGGSESLSRMPTSQNRDMGHPILWRVQVWATRPPLCCCGSEFDPSQLRLRVCGGEVALMYAAAAVSRTGLLLSSKIGRSASEISLS